MLNLGGARVHRFLLFNKIVPVLFIGGFEVLIVSAGFSSFLCKRYKTVHGDTLALHDHREEKRGAASIGEVRKVREGEAEV